MHDNYTDRLASLTGGFFAGHITKLSITLAKLYIT
jgi:hypothetical protein